MMFVKQFLRAYFTSGSVGGNSRRHLASILIGERERIESGTPFCNLEPIGIIPVGSSTRRFANINRSRTRVVECIIGFEANSSASCNVDRLGSRRKLETGWLEQISRLNWVDISRMVS